MESKIWGYHGGHYEEYYPEMWRNLYGRCLPTFRRNVLLQSSGLTLKSETVRSSKSLHISIKIYGVTSQKILIRNWKCATQLTVFIFQIYFLSFPLVVVLDLGFKFGTTANAAWSETISFHFVKYSIYRNWFRMRDGNLNSIRILWTPTILICCRIRHLRRIN
jgi:hypothetical protein